MIKTTGKEDRNDGIFFMEYCDFVKYYDKITVCELMPKNFKYKHVNLESNRTLIKVTLNEAQKVCFMFNSASQRMVRF